ncbi:MAG: peptidyl-prolyl cis-trans isomerase [Acidobacteria bacterium]|nr:peptidyl-prolyl cis-trans isomerase [Acidobacteriota bacterium]
MQASLALVALALLAAVAPPAKAHPRVTLDTSKGKIVIELYPDKSPKTVDNFVKYVKAGQYDGTVFHRVIAGFMIQGGGYDANGAEKPTRPPIENESSNGLENARGTIAMARTGDPHSATSQFYINVVDNPSLNYQAATKRWGYTVFGKVVSGMEVADAIAAVATSKPGDKPIEPVTIKKATVTP